MANQHSFTLADLERLVEQGGGNTTSQDSHGNDTSHRTPLAPEHIRTRIFNVVSRADGAVSRADIAKALKIKKTPWLITAIEGLVGDGFLTRFETIRANGVLMYWYEVHP
jgi:hypothetical protein